MVLTIIWDGFLLLVLLFMLAFIGFMIAVFTEPFRHDPMKEAERQAQLAQAQEEAAAHEAEQRMRLLSQWADERAHDRSRPQDRRQSRCSTFLSSLQ
jgi:Tfp pilus assembly protein PilX